MLPGLFSTTLWNLGVLIIISICLMYGYLYFNQERLIFMPRPMSAEHRAGILSQSPGVEEVELIAPDGVKLHGWFHPAPVSPAGAVIYCGGNAELVANQLRNLGELPGWSLLLMEYRGYGLSAGKPGETELVSDARIFYDHLTRDPRVDPDRIVVMGRSLGTGVAVQLAAHRPLRGAILITPFDSLVEVARRFYPLVPVSWLLRHRFDSLALAPTLDLPLLAIIAAEDEIIPTAHSANLLAAWRGPHQSLVVNGADHNNIHEAKEYWPAIRNFLDGLDAN